MPPRPLHAMINKKKTMICPIFILIDLFCIIELKFKTKKLAKFINLLVYKICMPESYVYIFNILFEQQLETKRLPLYICA